MTKYRVPPAERFVPVLLSPPADASVSAWALVRPASSRLTTEPLVKSQPVPPRSAAAGNAQVAPEARLKALPVSAIVNFSDEQRLPAPRSAVKRTLSPVT